MSIKRALAIALTATAALPAVAAAQTPVNPPASDAYLNPFFVNGGAGLKNGDILGFSADTTNYTTQTDMFDPAFDQNGNPVKGQGGPPEPTFCEGFNTRYGNTIWSAFRAAQYGVINISAASGNFDEVIRVVPFKSPNRPAPELPGTCFDDVAGSQQSASGLVFPGDWFAVQVGGTPSESTPAQGGLMQVKYSMGPPPKVDGDALLFWNQPPLRVTSLTVQGVTRGAKVTLTCTKRACKGVSKRASKPFWATPVGEVGPGAGSGVRMKDAVAGESSAHAAFRPVAHAAKRKFVLLKNRRVKKGGTIRVRITAPGFIGKSFFWKVRGKSLTNKKVSCMNPGSSKPRKLGTCHG